MSGDSLKSEWVDYPTAERFTGLSHTTLWRYVSGGEIRAARVGRSVRLHLPSLRTFMDERSSGGVLGRSTQDGLSGEDRG
jgi:excisionase family DNA binding protein